MKEMAMDFASKLLSLPILSVRQPWASYVVSGLKSIELRSWSTEYRGWLWIHTGKKPDSLAMQMLNLNSEEFDCGGLIGLAKIEECYLIDSEIKWRLHRSQHLSPGRFQGECYGWRITDALSLSDIIQCPGELGLFRLSGSIYKQVRQEIEGDKHNEFIECARELLIPSLGNILTVPFGQ